MRRISILVLIVLLISSCFHTSKLISETNFIGYRVRMLQSNKPESSSKYASFQIWAFKDKHSQSFYSFFHDKIYKMNVPDKRTALELVFDDTKTITLNSLDSFAFKQAASVFDSLKIQNLKSPIGATGFKKANNVSKS